MEKTIFVLVLVLASTIGGGCYEIDYIKIENCQTRDCINASNGGDMNYPLYCDSCVGNGHSSIVYTYNFSINCENEGSNQIESEMSYCLPIRRSDIPMEFLNESLSSGFFVLNNRAMDNATQMAPVQEEEMKACDNRSSGIRRDLIKRLAATARCSIASDICKNCPFLFNGTKCNVTFDNNLPPCPVLTTTNITASMSPSPTKTDTPTDTPTMSPSPTKTETPTDTPTMSPSPTPPPPGVTSASEIALKTLPPILTLILLFGIAIVVSFVFWYILRSKRQNTAKDLYASVDENSAAFQLATRGCNVTNTEVNNDNNNTPQDAVYTDIMENNVGERIRSNSQDIQDSDPVLSAELDTPTPTGEQNGLQVNVLYAGLVEGEVADTKLYQGLPYMKNQSAYTMEANPLYNFSAAKPFQEPACSLPELESAFEGCLYEIETGALDIGDKFASGQFGVVYRGTYRTEKGDIPVAVKALKDSVSKETIVAFMREAAIMAQFSHPNVLRLLGVKTAHQPWMIVTELLKTELRELLLKFRDTPSLTHMLRGIQLKFTTEIADGMEYLAMRNFVHRDLAARNVLVAKDLTIRIADFGMSREVGSEKNYYTSSGGIVPLRWTAPEAVFFQKYSEKSDVWSYGMTLYEIWTLGDKPWGSATNEEIIEALSSMTSISPPPGCPEGIGRIMLETWKHEKIDRPTFTGVKAMLSQL